MKKLCITLDTLDVLVQELYVQMPLCKVFTFSGSMGTGKTTIVKSLLSRCGITDVVVSPTFTYVAQYSNGQGEVFCHFDLYRLSSRADFIEAGFGEYLYRPGSWCFIEWPEIIMPMLQHNVCHVTLEYLSEFERSVIIEVIN